MDLEKFYTGFNFEAYEFLGAHYDKEQTTFRVYAPAAVRVSLVLNGKEMPMTPILEDRFYEIVVKDAAEGDVYEYRIYFPDGNHMDHMDPYGFGMEKRPAHKSVVRDLEAHEWKDIPWRLKKKDHKRGPVNIYEIHAGSFRKPGENPEDWYTYEELGDVLIPYLKETGYNYVEFMPLNEHPCDESWGYQATGFYAPTSRYGSAGQLQSLIDRLHQNGIGAIIDFVPAHFALDDYALVRYDGTELYEYPASDVSVSEWGSCNFIHSKGEVRSFLQSCADYWMTKYHFDGIRMDAISRVLYWMGDENRGENGRAVEFLKVMNMGLKQRHSDCLLIAEDSTNYPAVTGEIQSGGLGFDYKWDLGWMNDTLDYMKKNYHERIDAYHKLTFSMMYFGNEHYLLPLSHDEVVHGKATIAQKMCGLYEGKFPQARTLYLYMMTHPGKKLNFMGNEIAQLREWDEKKEQDWFMHKYPLHDSFYAFIKELNHLYLEHSALWEQDYEESGFKWLDCQQNSRCVYVYERNSVAESLITILNFSPYEQTNYRLPFEGKGEVLLDSDWHRFSGNTAEGKRILEGGSMIGIAPYSGMILRRC